MVGWKAAWLRLAVIARQVLRALKRIALPASSRESKTGKAPESLPSKIAKSVLDRSESTSNRTVLIVAEI